MIYLKERLAFWDKKLGTRAKLTPWELMDSFELRFNEKISERTFKEDLKKLKDDYNAPLKNERFDNRNRALQPTQKSHYFYETHFTITPKMPFTAEDADRIQQAIGVLKQFHYLPPFKHLENVLFKLEHEAQIHPTIPKSETTIIAFEQVTALVGFDRLEALYRAIQAKQVLRVYYKPFDAESKYVVLHPYFLKEFNNRWFVYGLNQDTNKVIPYAIDRIKQMDNTPLPFRPNTEIDFTHFFKNRIGISFFEGDEVETIHLKVAQPRAQYIITKPWHESQVVEEQTPQYVVFRFELVRNPELETQILAFGKDIEVLEPRHLKQQIKDVLTNALAHYDV